MTEANKTSIRHLGKPASGDSGVCDVFMVNFLNLHGDKLSLILLLTQMYLLDSEEHVLGT
jgi:hypothetical protein